MMNVRMIIFLYEHFRSFLLFLISSKFHVLATPSFVVLGLSSSCRTNASFKLHDIRYINKKNCFFIKKGSCGLFTNCLKNLFCFHNLQKIRSTMKEKSFKDRILNALLIFVMMGLTWIFGYFLLIPVNGLYQEVFQWLFTIFNVTQVDKIKFILAFVKKQIKKKNTELIT